MWRWLWILALCSAADPLLAARPQDSSSGPARPGDAAVLWETGQKSFTAGEYADAARSLKRYLDRYPAEKHVLDARYMLGLSYLRLKKPSEAIRPLKEYIRSLGRTTEAVRARIPLAEAYLQAKKYHESLLATVELTEKMAAKQVPNEIHLEALLLKTRALVALGEDFRARRALKAYMNGPQSAARTPELDGHYHQLSLDFKLRDCSKLPKAGPLEEHVFRDDLQKLGTCLLEALNDYYATLKTKAVESAREARSAYTLAWKRYGSICRNPPPPPGKKLSAIQLKRHREELQVVTEKDCEKTRGSIRETLASWKDKVAPGLSGEIDRLMEGI